MAMIYNNVLTIRFILLS